MPPVPTKPERDRGTPPPSTKPSFVADKSRASSPPTNSPPASPRRGVPGAVPPLGTPRVTFVAEDTPRAEPEDVVERNILAARAMARKILSKKGGTTRLDDFRSVLSQAAAIAPAARGDVLSDLPKSLYSLPQDAKGACLAELRELAGDMPTEFRKKFLQRLLEHLVSNRDSESDASSSAEPASDATQFQAQHASIESRRLAVNKLMQSRPDDTALQALKKPLAKTASLAADLGVIEAVIVKLDSLDPREQDKVIALFDDAGISWTNLLGALMHSPYMEEIGKLAKNTGLPLSARYLGTLTGDRVAMEKLLLTLGKTALPASLHVHLAGKIGMLRRTASPAPTLARAGRDLLLEIISLSGMSESKRCHLMYAVSEIDADVLLAALVEGDMNEHNDYWIYAHQVMADAIDIGACYALVNDNDDDADLASYAVRARNLMKDDSVKTIVSQAKCAWNAARLRALILGKPDPKEVKRAVFNVINSNLSYTAKLALLKCEIDPVGPSVEAHVKKAQYQAALEYYRKSLNGSPFDNSLAYEVVEDDLKKHAKAYRTLTKKLDPDAIDDIRAKANMAMVAAQHSRLPAMHVAARLCRADIVRVYMETVAGFAGVMNEDEITGFLELSSNGISLFHNAMINGTPDVVTACMSVILASELKPATKLLLLEARRKPDRIGAFYLAMSCGLEDTALEFVQGILTAGQIEDKAKVQLLKCAKRAPYKKVAPDSRTGAVLAQAASTARAEAERNNHDRLAENFGFEVERSPLSFADRQDLQVG